jgi:hypothetical protein
MKTKSNLMSKFGIISVASLDAVQFVFQMDLSNVYAGNLLALLDVDGVVFRFLASLRRSTKQNSQ